MVEVDLDNGLIEKAKVKAEEMGVLNNSILQGNGSVAGFIGEQIALHCLGGTWENTYEYDIVLPDGSKIDVKTKQTSVTPLPEYDCSVANFNTKQECDAYAFVRVRKDFRIGWFLGLISKDVFFKKARFLRKGEIDPSNNFVVRANCYNLSIGELS